MLNPCFKGQWMQSKPNKAHQLGTAVAHRGALQLPAAAARVHHRDSGRNAAGDNIDWSIDKWVTVALCPTVSTENAGDYQLGGLQYCSSCYCTCPPRSSAVAGASALQVQISRSPPHSAYAPCPVQNLTEKIFCRSAARTTSSCTRPSPCWSDRRSCSTSNCPSRSVTSRWVVVYSL